MTGNSQQNSGEEDIVIARIVKPRGIRGEVNCIIQTDFPERFSSLESVTVWLPNDARVKLKIEDSWFHNDRVILKFEGYDTMTAAQDLTGGRLVIADSDPELLEDGQFFEHQVIGSEVVTSTGRSIGRVKSVMRTGGTDILVLQTEEGVERMVPFADEICTEVDVNAKRITVDPPDGLLDL
ncbi:MAG TPA: ribosome maturation factor RimM [Blastocatellia bacterium]|nr:ribosome maturation factor RimM [Blastocatellia bacterium]